MIVRNPASALATSAAALFVCLAIAGCDGVPIDPGADAGIVIPGSDAGVPIDPREDGGPPIARDGGPPPDPDGGEACSADWNCEDWDACTRDACVAGVCTYTWIDACEGCRSDAECDDGRPSTEDVCDTFTRSCSHLPVGPCDGAADCDDGNPCTDDQCSPGTGYCAWGSVPDCCFRASDCDDADSCTTDACGGDHVCANEPIPGCGSSTCDFDRDGHGSMHCWPPGDDCDDFDPARHGGATEDCDNGIDDDCDGLRDRTDEACSAGNTTCATASSIDALPYTTAGSVISTSGGSTTTCGPSAFWSLALAETSDVTITLRLHEFAAEPPPCPGCPAPEPPMEIHYAAFLERTCGDRATDLGGDTGTSCQSWRPRGDGFFSGSRETTRTLRRVPAGSYSLEVQAGEWFGWMTRAIEFDLEVRAVPSAMPECAMPLELTDGMVLDGSTEGRPDAFGTDCRGASVASPEAVHAITLTERRRVRLWARGTPPAGATYAPAIRLGLRGSCDPDGARDACVDGTSGSIECDSGAILERMLDPGRHYLTVENGSASWAAYTLAYTSEPIGAACEGAAAIAGSGSITGTTAGASDRFRWNDAGCGSGAGPDVVYTLTLAAPSRVVLDLIASYEGPMLRVLRGCGESIAAGSGTRTRVDTTLDPGTYQVVIGGTRATSSGSFVLNTTIL